MHFCLSCCILCISCVDCCCMNMKTRKMKTRKIKPVQHKTRTYSYDELNDIQAEIDDLKYKLATMDD